MASQFNKYLFLGLSALCLLIAMLTEKGTLSTNSEKKLIGEFQAKIIEKEKALEERLGTIQRLSESSGFFDAYLTELAPFTLPLENNGTGFLLYKNGLLFYWSDRAIAFRETLPLSVEENSSVVQFQNGYYLTRTVEKDTLTLVGLILIKYNYTHENKYLKNEFFRDLYLPDSYELVRAGSEGSIPIYNLNGENVFSLSGGNEVSKSQKQPFLSALLYFAGLLLLMTYVRKATLEMGGGALTRLLVTTGFLFVIYWLHVLFHIPGVFSKISFFSPSQFALSGWLPSLGDFFLLSFFFFYLMLNAFRDFRIHHLEIESGIRRPILLLILFTLTASVYQLTDHFISQLAFNSSFSFTLNRINEITLPTVVGIASIMFLLIGQVLLTLRMADEARKVSRVKHIVAYLLISAAIPSAIRHFTGETTGYPAVVLYLATFVISLFYAFRTTKKYGMSYLILFISLITIYSIKVIYGTTDRKEQEIMKLMGVTLVSEHDPAAEVFLVEIQQEISVDPNIPRYLIPPFTNLDEYLEIKYFSGFFRQYDLQITLCTGSDSLFIQPQNTLTPCFPFFDEMIKNQGIPLPGTNFYYMDNMDGRITYFGKLHYPLSSDSIGVSVFIELKSRIQSEGIGFPELLIDKSMQKPASYKRFDYAKYFGGELVDKHGQYPYNYYIYSYSFDDSEYSFNRWDGYEHLIYRTREDNYVIVSRSLYTFVDFLISFPYLFVFYFLGSLAILPFIRPSFRKWKVMFDLKFRIQAAIISIVFVSLLLVALSTIFYNVEESRARLQEDLDQKMNSISVELDSRLENAREITPEITEWLMPELVRLSNIFQTDINIYDVDGDMIVSSRPEIFNRGLVSRRINTQAYFELFENFQTNYFQPEKIGSLRYLSAYEPIINSNGDYLGFINLPYFTHQDKYSQEISTFIVAFINLYVLLFLASIVIAVFIANQITQPLVIIRENLRKIELGKRNEPINYDREDEIGKLVREYNKKVDELAVSAELLARSERESAWREMAKQVAHEIKNPLTPMKLNIQHLQRFRGEGSAYREYVDRVAQTLINQIDNLSDIATEFSNFAKIPTAMKQVFHLTDQITKVIELYENHDKVKIRFDRGDCSGLKVNADREQLSRALINLIKNGIQAIPDDREGVINIKLQRQEHLIQISVADNGSGITPELQEKMFSPNFTTKTSGMGLGLAIVKNIAENFNGRVWYETAPNEGTTFFLEIPVFEENQIENS